MSGREHLPEGTPWRGHAMNDAEIRLRGGGIAIHTENVGNETGHDRGPGMAADVAGMPATHFIARVAPDDHDDVGAGHHWTWAIAPAMYSMSSALKLGPEGR